MISQPATKAQSHIDCIVDSIAERGYGVVRRDDLDLARVQDEHLLQQAARYEQAEDPAPGRRWRSHSKMIWVADGFKQLPEAPYVQRYDDNPDAGGKERAFRSIAEPALCSATLKYLLEFNRAIAREVVPSAFVNDSAQVGLHLVSYRPCMNDPSYASPAWFHKDTEEFVAVVLISLSRNLGGGENAISTGGRFPNSVVTLRDPLDMLLLTRRDFHTVMPMYSLDGRMAYRDVLLITFG